MPDAGFLCGSVVPGEKMAEKIREFGVCLGKRKPRFD